MDTVPPPPPSASKPQQRQFPCKQCGATLLFAPGTTGLKCPYCGAENEIAPVDGAAVVELDFHAALARMSEVAPTVDVVSVHCDACGAESSFNDNVVASKCPFCGHAIVATSRSQKLIKPGAVLPFAVTREQAIAAFRAWVMSRWFAPSDLKRLAERSKIDGAYVPAWTYDAQTFSYYTGERGDDYWDTEHYTERDSDGNTVSRTRQVRKTRWWPVSGQVDVPFDDVLVLATHTLPRKLAVALEPWDLPNCVPYRDEYLSGFVTESYQTDLGQGFDEARGIMDGGIRQVINRQIGGDHQRIHSVDTRYDGITFKHVLLPLWISAYLYRERSFRFLVNARTGEVQGERPYSWAKIALLVIAIVVAVVAVVLLVRRHQ
ncbi:MAG TPA: hypothetical protein VEA69_12825 [Tepidisphaeraceae bacterium]|nr:hypothetical protein [Tepidisphaeraceae bacterium]